MSKFAIAVVAALILCSGCSSKSTKPQAQTVTVGDVTAVITPEPDPFTPGSVHGVPDAGTDDLLIKLTDPTTNAPIVDAIVTVQAVTQLTGATGDTQTGKSNGDGSYHVDKLSMPVSEVYTLHMLVDRPGKQERKLDFTLTPQ